MEQAAALPESGNQKYEKVWDRHGSAILTALCLLFILLAVFAGKYRLSALETSFYVAAYLIGGYQKALEGLTTLFKEKNLDVDLLMVIAAIGAASIGYWMDGAILIFIFSLSGALEDYTMEKTNRDIRSIMKLLPEEAVLLVSGVEKKVKADRLQPGDLILVKPGERIPADGIITAGSSAVNQSSITGEPIPLDKSAGDEVFSGTINGQGAIEVRVSKPAEETMLAKIIHLVKEARDEKPAGQQFVERFEGIYARVVVAAAVLFILIPPFLLGWGWHETVYRAMIFLVVASPCALVSSIMPAMLSAISNAARNGVLFKGAVHLQQIAGVKVVAFDKTGTITTGEPAVTAIIPVSITGEDTLLTVVASLETHSEHPVAKAIVQEAKQRGLLLRKPVNLQASHGLGISGTLDTTDYRVGKREMIREIIIGKMQEELITALEEQGKTVIYVASGGELTGILAVQDTMRRWAPKIIGNLKRMGIRVVMLTGDTLAAANAIAGQAGIDEVYADLLPEHKADVVKQLEKNYGNVAMVGDGVNDAPALATAAVGIAVGSGGIDAAMETADVILMRDNIENIPFAIHLGRRTKRVISQNIVFAIAVALTLVVMNFIGGMINLPEGVIGHEGSTVLVILSGLRLLK